MATFTDEVMRGLLASSLQTATMGASGWQDSGQGPGSTEGSYINWLTISESTKGLVEDVTRIRNHPLVPGDIPIYGYLYDVKRGGLKRYLRQRKQGKFVKWTIPRTQRPLPATVNPSHSAPGSNPLYGLQPHARSCPTRSRPSYLGDPTRSGPGFKEIEVPSDLPAEVMLTEQHLQPGSYGEVDLSGFSVTQQTKFKIHVFATRPDQAQTLFSIVGESGPLLVLTLAKRRLVAHIGKTELLLREQPLQAKRWYQVEILADLQDGVVTGTLTPQPSRSPGQDVFERFEPHTVSTVVRAEPMGPLQRCLFAASSDGDHFDGRLARPVLTLDATTLEWDFSKDMGGRQIVDVSGHDRHGLLHQLPARAVTGPAWDGSHQAWTAMPSHYDAIHFHSDDLYDAAWPAIAELTVPA